MVNISKMLDRATVEKSNISFFKKEHNKLFNYACCHNYVYIKMKTKITRKEPVWILQMKKI